MSNRNNYHRVTTDFTLKEMELLDEVAKNWSRNGAIRAMVRFFGFLDEQTALKIYNCLTETTGPDDPPNRIPLLDSFFRLTGIGNDQDILKSSMSALSGVGMDEMASINNKIMSECGKSLSQMIIEEKIRNSH